ncbi:MAG: hypothetical protein PHE49_04690 [bacterium]|nr:hypothetical protein [bacterium]
MRRTHMERSRRHNRRTWRKLSTRLKPSANDLKTEKFQGVLRKLHEAEKAEKKN